jgi:predicted O-methyltransferase YrrM
VNNIIDNTDMSPGSHRPPEWIAGLRDLVAACITEPGAIVVEVGNLNGDSARVFLESPNVRVLIAVDPFETNPDPYWNGDRDRLARARVAFHRDVVLAHPGRVVAVPLTSLDAAAALFADGSLDLVYVDADHRYDGVAADLRAWRPKVKPGGWIAGHDFESPMWPDVARAVRDVLGEPSHRFGDLSFALRVP